jgi:hypothetical protein
MRLFRRDAKRTRTPPVFNGRHCGEHPAGARRMPRLASYQRRGRCIKPAGRARPRVTSARLAGRVYRRASWPAGAQNQSPTWRPRRSHAHGGRPSQSTPQMRRHRSAKAAPPGRRPLIASLPPFGSGGAMAGARAAARPRLHGHASAAAVARELLFCFLSGRQHKTTKPG